VQDQSTFHSGAAGIQVFVEMNFGDAVVVETDGLAYGILRNFESPIQIPSQRRFEIKTNRESESMRFQALKKIGPVWGLVQDGREMFGHGGFIVAAFGRQHSAAIDSGILMVDAGGER
jgi:hypothetical protein